MIFGHIFCKDHIDIHQQIYSILDLSLYRSYSQSDFSVPFFQKSYHIKTIVPSEMKFIGFFSSKNHNFHIYGPIMLVCKVVFLVIELSGNTMHGFIC